MTTRRTPDSSISNGRPAARGSQQRRWLAAVLALALAGAPVAARADSDVPIAAGHVTNGTVNAVAVDTAGRIYLGGSFTQVGPRTGRGLELTTTDDQADPTFPDVNGQINAAVPDGTGGWFIGGTFTAVGDLTRNRLAHVLGDGSVDATWNPNVVFNAVTALAVSGGDVYVGGTFTVINGATARNRLARIPMGGDGTVDPTWDPNANGSVRALAISGSDLLVGGDFTAINGATTRNRLAKIPMGGDGTVDATWDPNANSSVNALTVSGTDVFVGGNFTAINGATTRNHLAKIPTGGDGTVDPDWDPNANAFVNALTVSGSDVYVGGAFTTLNGATTRNRLAKIPTGGDGIVDADWNPNPNITVTALAVVEPDVYVGGAFTTLNGATARNRLAKIPTTGTGTVDPDWNPNANATVFALAVAGTDVFAGGAFTSAGSSNLARNRLARLSSDGSVDASWNPNVANHAVNALALSDGDLYVGGSFTAINGSTPRNRLAKIPTNGDGTVDATWDPDADNTVNALTVAGTEVYAGGAFTTLNGATTRNRIAKIPTGGDGTVDAAWDPDADGSVNALAVSGSNLYVGGAFTTLNGATTRNRLAKIPLSGDGTIDPDWNPNANGSVHALTLADSDVYAGGEFTTLNGATPRSRLAKIPASGDGTVDASWNATVANNTVSALAVAFGNVYVGGSFTFGGGDSRNRIARLSSTTGATDATWDPNAQSTVHALAVSGTLVTAGGDFGSMRTRSNQGVAFFTIDPGALAGVTVDPIAGLTTSEAGGTAMFTVVLDAEPVGDVVIDLASSDPTEGTLSAAQLTFTGGVLGTWSTPQAVTVTGVADAIADGNQPYNITVTTNTAATADPAYDAIDPDDVAVTNDDDDAAGVTVGPTSGLTTTETGGTATFTVALASEPTGDVVIDLASSDTGEGTVSPAQLTFTGGLAGSWSTPQTVTVTGIDDGLVDGDQPYTITVTTDTAASADPAYDAIDPADVAVTNVDDDIFSDGFESGSTGAWSSAEPVPLVGSLLGETRDDVSARAELTEGVLAGPGASGQSVLVAAGPDGSQLARVEIRRTHGAEGYELRAAAADAGGERATGWIRLDAAAATSAIVELEWWRAIVAANGRVVLRVDGRDLAVLDELATPGDGVAAVWTPDSRARPVP